MDLLHRTPLPALPELPKSPAEAAFASLVAQIRTVEKSTSPDEVVVAMLAAFGQSVVVHVHQLRRAGQMFVLEGVTESGTPATLVQHFTQASILLLKAPRLAEEEKRPIGFLS